MAASTVTGNVSVVLVNSPETRVFLSSVGYPGHIVTIKDNAGLASQGTPIVVSTTNGIFFADGSISTLLQNPFSYLTVSSKSPTQWQILNNQAYLTTLSNAFVETLTAGNAYVTLASTVKEYISSAIIGTVNVTKTLNLAGNVDILGDVVVGGVVDLFSTLDVREDIRFSSALLINGDVTMRSTLSLQGDLIVGGSVSTLNDLNVGQDLFVRSSMYVNQTLVPKHLSVQTLFMQSSIEITGPLIATYGISTGLSFEVGSSVSSMSSFTLLSSATILGFTNIRDNLTVQNRFQTDTLESLSSGYVTKEVMAGSLEVSSIFSTAGSLTVKGTIFAEGQTNVKSVVVTGEVSTNSLIVSGDAEISSITTSGDVEVLGNASLLHSISTGSFEVPNGTLVLLGNMKVLGMTSVSSFFSTTENVQIGGNLTVGSTLFLKGSLSTVTIQNISSFEIYDTFSTMNLYVESSLTVNKNFTLNGPAVVGVLGAPITIGISTLTLSNTFYQRGTGSIPELTITNGLFPCTIRAGIDLEPDMPGIFIQAVPDLYISGSFLDQKDTATTEDTSKEISTLRISTLSGAQTTSILVGSNEVTFFPPVVRFAVDAETRFQNGFSSLLLEADSIVASSITAISFIGDASLMTGVTWFGSTMGVSSILAEEIYVSSFFYYQNDFVPLTISKINCETLSNQDAATLSTFPITIAVGQGAISNYNIQYTNAGIQWLPASNPSFEEAGQGIYGNFNITTIASNTFTGETLFVATGIDSRTNYTIQYSSNAYDWYPAESGGFDIEDVFFNGLKVGNTVNYFQTVDILGLNTWLVGGNSPGTQSTIFYSYDGKNFRAANPDPCLQNAVNVIKSKRAGNPVALAVNSSYNLIKSSDGINWSNPNPTSNFFGFAFGTINGTEAWYATGLFGGFYRSEDNGDNWVELNPVGVPFIRDIVYSGLKTDGTFSNVGSFLAYSQTDLYSIDNTYNFNLITSATTLGIETFVSLAWNPADTRWYLGARSSNKTKTIFTSIDSSNWIALQDPTNKSGFSSATVVFGTGYGVAIDTSVFPSFIFAGGIGSPTGLTKARPQILQVISNDTSNLLSGTNSSNVFKTTVYGVGVAPSNDQQFKFVAVGDGVVPQKTIARSSDRSNWIPAVTGGFTTGYGVTYYSTTTQVGSDPPVDISIWIAVGSSVDDIGSIQYSSDGANWFPTNRSGGLSLGGRAIATFPNTTIGFSNTVYAVGEHPFDPDDASESRRKTILYSITGFDWFPITNGGFQYGGYGVATGPINMGSNGIIAVGDARYGSDSLPDPGYSIQYSSDGLNFTNVGGSNGFTTAGYGIAYGNNLWVAVGSDSNPIRNIQYSLTGLSWSEGGSNKTFDIAGYGVAFDSNSSNFIAVGASKSNVLTILQGSNGYDWTELNLFNFTPNGFLSEEIFGVCIGLFGQTVRRNVKADYLEFPNFRMYDASEPLAYPFPTMRLQSTYTCFNEVTYVNISSQVIINSNAPFGSNTVTVNGDVHATNFYFIGSEPVYRDVEISSLIVSTIFFESSLRTKSLTTPAIGFRVSTLANYIKYLDTPTRSNLDTVVSINDTINVEGESINISNVVTSIPPYNAQVGINTLPMYQQYGTYTGLTIEGTVACSTLLTGIYKQSKLEIQTPNQTSIEFPSLSVFEGTNPSAVTKKNTIYSATSSITFNNALTVNLSTQRVGLFTENPLFDFDVRTAGLISSLSTSYVTTKAIFLTLQSF